MKILSRYLFKNVSVMFLIIFSLLLGVSFLIEVLSETASDLTKGVKFIVILSNSLGFSLEFIHIIFSFIALLSVVVAVILMNNKYEMVAIRCIGISDIKIARPFFLFALLVSVFFYINQSYLVREFRTTIKFKDIKSKWYSNENLLFFKTEKQNNSENNFRVFVLNQSKNAVEKIVNVNDGKATRYLTTSENAPQSDVNYVTIFNYILNQNRLNITFKNLEFLPFEKIIHQIISGRQPADYYFVLTKKISQLLIFFVYAWLAVIISNTPVRSYGFVNRIIMVVIVWIITYGMELVGMRLYENKNMHWFMSGSLNFWFVTVFTVVVYLNVINQNMLFKRMRDIFKRPY